MGFGKKSYLRHPIKNTGPGQQCLRCRLSLRETQKEFAERFGVSHITVHRWESGKIIRIGRIHQLILDQLQEQLKDKRLLMPESVFTTIFREEAERHGLVS